MRHALPRIEAERIERAAAALGTPLYLYDAAALRARAAALRAALPGVSFAYSLKANPNVSIVRALAAEGIGAEVCSLCELEAALLAGVDPSRILFVGPAKSPVEIARAVAVGVCAVAAESVEEIALLGEAACRAGRVQPVALRINPSFEGRGARLAMSGRATQFGIDRAEMARAAHAVAGHASLRLEGLHVYMGTRILEADRIVENTLNVLGLAEELEALAGGPLGLVDVGGGFGVPYAAEEPELDLARLGRELAPRIAAWRRGRPSRVMVELGRYLVAEAGVFVTSVLYAKTTRGKRFAVCDGGANCHAAAGQAASFRRGFPVAPVRPRPGPARPWQVTGPLCTPTDVVAQDAPMPDPRPGDLLRIDRSGAYGPTASPTAFLSFGAPAEAMLDGPFLTVIRERQDVADMLGPQTPRPVPAAPAEEVPA